MEYLSKNHKKNSFKKRVILFVVFFIMLFAFVFGQVSFLYKPLVVVAKPLGSLKDNSIEFIGVFFSFLGSKKNLIDENKLLKEEMSNNELFLVNQKILCEENSALKKLLGRIESNSNLILANVILKPGLSVYNSLILDIGTNEGIAKGNRVLAGGSIFIGEISEVYSHSSKVKLYSFPEDKLNVVIGFNKILTIAEGKGDGVYEIKLPQGIEIIKGDIVTFPEEDIRILGIVEEIIINPEDPFETILVKSPVNIFELRWTQVIKEE